MSDQASDQASDQSESVATDPLVEFLEEQVDYMREQLRREREASAELRRIVAGLVQRVPELEASREARESPETGSEGVARER